MHHSLSDYVLLGDMITLGISGITGIFIMPLIFKFFVTPKIEKKVGRKLKTRPIYDYFLFGNFTYGYIDIVGYLAYKYLAWKIKGDPDAIKMSTEYGLGEVDYRVENASQLEMVMTLLACINFLIALICIVIMFLILAIYK